MDCRGPIRGHRWKNILHCPMLWRPSLINVTFFIPTFVVVFVDFLAMCIRKNFNPRKGRELTFSGANKEKIAIKKLYFLTRWCGTTRATSMPRQTFKILIFKKNIFLIKKNYFNTAVIALRGTGNCIPQRPFSGLKFFLMSKHQQQNPNQLATNSSN